MKAAHHKGHTLKHARRHVKHRHKGIKHHPAHHGNTATKHAHHVHAKAKHATHAKGKGLALPGDVACCTIEALAASLRGQGLSVADSDVLDLFRLAGGDDDRGMPVRAALEAASEFGLGGVRLARFGPAPEGGSYCGCNGLGDLVNPFWREDRELSFDVHSVSVILGVELPGQHTVLATPDGWWSWGELWCPCEFPDAVIDEAWAVTWA